MAETTHALIAGAQPHVRKIAQQLSRGRPQRTEDLFQIGMTTVCEEALRRAGMEVEDFLAATYMRVRGAMLNELGKESREQRLRAALTRAVGPAAEAIEFGNMMEPEEARVAHRRRTTDALITAAAIALTLPSAERSNDPLAEAEAQAEEARVQRGLDAGLAELGEEDRALVKAVFYEGAGYREIAGRLGTSASTVCRRVGVVLGRLGARARRG